MEEAAIPAEQSDAPAVGGTPKSTPDAASLPLPDEAAWSITTKTSRDAVETFLRDYPDSPRAADARRALDQIAQDALRLARQAGTAQALRNWIVAWPGRPEIPQARIALDAANKRDLGRGLDEAREQAKLAQPKTVNQSGTVSKGGCATSQFTIYFDWDRVSLNPTAVDAIDTALARARRGNCQFAAVRVVGHTDTERSAQYAQGLSLRRADAVRDALAARGVPLALITVEGRGETELARATPDGVREPLNRRAEVSFTFR
jgi:outer membrane protein OmpA-like peptidoglycan-associated protein